MTTYYNDIAPVVGANMNFGYQLYILNQEAATKYFKVVGITNTGGWTPGAAQELGAMGVTSNKRFDCIDLMQRTTPVAHVTEDVTIRVSRYADAGYTVWEEDRDIVITHNLIDSDAMTLVAKDDFDDGTTQDWTIASCEGNSAICDINVDNTYYISTGHSLKTHLNQFTGAIGPLHCVSIVKDFVVPNVSNAYGILNLMARRASAATVTGLYIYEDGIEKASLITSSGEIPVGNWLRFVIPLTPNGTRSIKIKICTKLVSGSVDMWFYLDDFKVVTA